MKEYKTLIVSGALVLALLILAVNNRSNSADKASILKAEAGLEECQIRPGFSTTLWVRDCVSYMKQQTTQGN